MKITELTNQDLIVLVENASELGTTRKYQNKDHVESFIGLATHRSGYYGLYNPVDGTTAPLDKTQTVFNTKSDVNILIEGYVKLNSTPVNNGEGNIVYHGYGTLEVLNSVIYSNNTFSTNTSPSELVFDRDYEYTETSGNKAWTIASLIGFTGTNTIIINKTIDTDDVVTIDLSDYNIDISGEGWTNNEGIWTANVASSSDFNATVRLEIVRLGETIVKVESSWSEPWSIESSPYVIEFFDGLRGVNTSGTATWTGQKSGMVFSASGFSNPTHSVDTWSGNGTTQAFEESATLAPILKQALNGEALTMYVVQRKATAQSGVNINPVNIYSTTDGNPSVAVQNGSAQQAKFVVRDSTGTSLTATGSSTTLDAFEIIKSSYDPTNLNVALDSDAYSTTSNTLSGNFNAIDRVGLFYRKLGVGTATYYDCDIKAVVFCNGTEDESRILTALTTKFLL